MASNTKTILFSKSDLNEYNSYIEGKVDWTSEKFAGENRSQLKLTVYVRKKNIDPNTKLTIPTDGKWPYALKVGDKAKASSSALSVTEEWAKVVEYTTSIPHNEDGSKTITIAGFVSAPNGTNFEGLSTVLSDIDIDLGKISREATIDSLKCNSTFVDGEITAEYTPKSSAHYIRRIAYVNVNGALTQICDEKLDKRTVEQHEDKFTFIESQLSTIYSKVTNTTTATIRVTFQTYSNSGYTTKIGNDQYREIKLTLPTTVVPTADLVVTPVNSSSWIAARNLYVAGLSGAKAILTAKSGQGITADPTTNIVYNGAKYSTAELNVTTLKTPGAIKFTGKVTDSRGRSASVDKEITVLQYSPPAITSMRVERGTYEGTNWTAKEDGSDVRVLFKATLALVNEDNIYSAAFEIDGENKTPINGALTGLDSGAEVIAYFSGLDSEVSYDLKLKATDSVGQTRAATITIPTTQVTMDFHESGTGIAFGKAPFLGSTWRLPCGRPWVCELLLTNIIEGLFYVRKHTRFQAYRPCFQGLMVD